LIELHLSAMGELMCHSRSHVTSHVRVLSVVIV